MKRVLSTGTLIVLICISIFLSLTLIIPSSGDLSLNVNDSETFSGNRSALSPLSSADSGESPVESVQLRETDGLGFVNITYINIKEYRDPTPGGDYAAFYPGGEQLAGNITMERDLSSFNFIGTIRSASAERSMSEGELRVSNVTILINETVIWNYWDNATLHVVGYRPYITPYRLVNMYLNGTRLSSDEYFTSLPLIGDGFYYDFEDVFTQHPNGTLIITYEYEADIEITQWQVKTTSDEYYLTPANLINHTDIKRDFSYKIGFGRNGNPMNITVGFYIQLPDPDEIYGVNMTGAKFDLEKPLDSLTLVDDGAEWKDYDEQEKHFTIYIDMNDFHTITDIYFSANFTVRFLDVVDGYWCLDKLIDTMYHRERYYKITVDGGPETLCLEKIWLNDTSIHYKELYGTSNLKSALGRSVRIENMNYSTENYYLGIENVSYSEIPEGISIFGPDYYLWKGEIDYIVIEYSALETLSFVIADKITNPLPGYKANIFIGDKLFGPVVSLYKTHPLGTLESNHNGQVILNFVPRGNYTIEVLDPSGNPVVNLTATTEKPINILVTPVSHFPLTAIVLGIISIGLVIVGTIIYRKRSE